MLKVLVRVPLTLCIALAALAIAAAPALHGVLQYDRDAVLQGQLWRLISCHFVHWNLNHFQWDFLMFVVLGAWCELRQPRAMALCVPAAMVMASATVFWWLPEIQLYRGLSGLDTALFTLLAVGLLQESLRERRWSASLITGMLLAALGAKTAYEAFTGHTLFVDDAAAGFEPVVFDHIAGALAGIGIGVVTLTPRDRPIRAHRRRLTTESTEHTESATSGFNSTRGSARPRVSGAG